MKSLTDHPGNPITFKNPPQRIISLVPSQTELLCDLGLEENLVGITKFCVHPEHLKSAIAIVGGTKKVNYEKIVVLRPDIIIANKEENTLEMVLELQKIAPVWVTNIISLEDNLQMISDFGEIFNCPGEAKNWIDKIALAFEQFRNEIRQKPTRKAAYLIWKKPYMTAGADTFINEILKLNRFENVYDLSGNRPLENGQRYPEIRLEELAENPPEIVFLSSEPYPFNEKDADEIRRIAPFSNVVIVDGEMFSWYGSRLIKAVEYFRKLQQTLG